MTRRPHAAVRLPNDARAAARRRDRATVKYGLALAERDAAAAELERIHRETCERFGRALPCDPTLLDILTLVDVEPGDRWVWRGMRNNKGMPTVRLTDRSERSAVRYLAVALGVVGSLDHGMLFPIDGDRDDVNPWHRSWRRCGSPVGNPNRYGTMRPVG